MQRLEQTLHDLGDQDRSLDTAELIAGVERLLNETTSVTLATRPVRRRRPVITGLAAAAAAIVLVGAVPLILYLIRSDTSDPVSETPATAPLTETVVTPIEPAETSPPAEEAAPEPTVAAELVAPTLWQEWAADKEQAARIETPLGTLSTYKRLNAPYQWIESGFPKVIGAKPEAAFWQIWADAHSGLEIFESEAGYLGLGSTAGPDAPRIILNYDENLVRVRGLGSQAEIDAIGREEAWDSVLNPWGAAEWAGEFYFSPDELWFSADGSSWDRIADAPFGPNVAMRSQPDSVAHRDGTWIVIAETGATSVHEEGLEGVGRPAAWISSDLETWNRLPIDLEPPGELFKVTAGEGGWIISGSRAPSDTGGPSGRTFWLSVDGVEWHEFHLADVVGTPECDGQELASGESCVGWFRATAIEDGIAIYAVVEIPEIDGEFSGYGLWVGLWED